MTQAQALQIAREALEANHEWHQADDEYGYAESELRTKNMVALAALTVSDAQPVAPNIKTWSERIYLQYGEMEIEEYPGCAGSDVTWADSKIEDGDVEYVRADLASPAPDVPPSVPVSDEQIRRIAETLPKPQAGRPEDHPSWGHGYRRDENGNYTVPVLPVNILPFARALLAQAAPAVPDGWRKFVEDCSKTAGGMVNGNHLSILAGRLLAAAPSAPSADPLQFLADEAQDLDMGYGPDACEEGRQPAQADKDKP